MFFHMKFFLFTLSYLGPCLSFHQLSKVIYYYHNKLPLSKGLKEGPKKLISYYTNKQDVVMLCRFHVELWCNSSNFWQVSHFFTILMQTLTINPNTFYDYILNIYLFEFDLIPNFLIISNTSSRSFTCLFTNSLLTSILSICVSKFLINYYLKTIFTNSNRLHQQFQPERLPYKIMCHCL